MNDKKRRHKSYRYVWNETDFNTVDPTQTDFLLGTMSLVAMKFLWSLKLSRKYNTKKRSTILLIYMYAWTSKRKHELVGYAGSLCLRKFLNL